MTKIKLDSQIILIHVTVPHRLLCDYGDNLQCGSLHFGILLYVCNKRTVKYDAIILGGNIGSLVSAKELARAGKKIAGGDVRATLSRATAPRCSNQNVRVNGCRFKNFVAAKID